MLYGTNVERLGSAPGTFANHCLPYTGFYLMGNAFFGWNCFAPLFSFPTRTAIRRKFNLEVSSFIKFSTLCSSIVMLRLQGTNWYCLFEEGQKLTFQTCYFVVSIMRYHSTWKSMLLAVCYLRAYLQHISVTALCETVSIIVFCEFRHFI